jgi:transglutaminase superfamily protein
MVSLRARLNSWRRFRRLPACERWLCLQAMPVLIVTIAGLRLFGLRRWQSVLTHLTCMLNHRDEQDGEVAARRARTVARAVRRAAIYGPCRGTCLAEALVVWSLLRRQGIDGDLQIGVRRSGTGVEAHAWIAVQGQAVTEGENLVTGFVSFGRSIGDSGGI